MTNDAGFHSQNAFCGLTQGGYGNAGGNYCGLGTVALLNSLLIPHNGMVIGWPANNKTFTIPANGAQCVLNILPGGGTSSVLPGIRSCSNLTGLLGSQGRLKNSLLAQTITLQLNLWWSPTLGNLQLTSPHFYTQASSNCANANAQPIGSAVYWNLPNSVYTALGSNPTVQGLLVLANKALGGVNVGSCLLSDICKAVDIINNAFDECRFVTFTAACKSLEVETSAPAPNPQLIDMNIVPNPFAGQTDISYTLAEDSKVSVEIYNLVGAKVATLYEGEVMGGQINKVTYEPSNSTGNQVLLCIIRTANGIAEKRMVLMR
jgi:hypothetical protein